MADSNSKKKIDLDSYMNIPVMVLRGLVLFPEMVLHFDIYRESSALALSYAMTHGRKIFVTTQKDSGEDFPEKDGIYRVGVMATIRQIVKAGDETMRVVVEGDQRFKIVEFKQTEPYFCVDIEPYALKRTYKKDADYGEALARTNKDLFEDYASMSGQLPQELVRMILQTTDYRDICEPIIKNIPVDFREKQRILAESSHLTRLEMLATILDHENEVLSIEIEIQDRVRGQLDKNQREYYLREQVKIINSELGNDSEDEKSEEMETYRNKIIAIEQGIKVTEKLLKEVDRLEKMHPNTQDAASVRGYLDTVLELPWNVVTEDKIDIVKAEKHLEKEHFGMEKVKKRILESLAVRKLAPDIKGQIICLLGPPGVGKTSIARSIAEAMDRKYVRLSLGGVRDESDIRGHRRTYVASMPGRVINAIKTAESANPLMLLDEIDKLGNDFRGDPSSALLEVLDGEQNSTFRDHYLEIPFDLSGVFFIATANSLEGIPAPLRDRMEIIQLGSYTREEKFNIAKKHLVQKQLKRHGISKAQLSFTNSGLYSIVDFYTKEAGVRTLERLIGTVARKVAVQIVSDSEFKKVSVSDKNIEEFLGLRKYKQDDIAKKDIVGVTNGLAWTSVGGEMLQVEVAVLDGSGKHRSTGSLGDVMKESVQAATTYIRSVSKDYNISETFYKDTDIHIHFPEGAVPKDGPSAGITTCTALVSALSGIPVRHDVAMTGEITLRGRVLPIGGLREKTMAAYKHGMRTVIIPAANLPDLEEVEQVVKDNINFVAAETIDTVLKHALVSKK